MGNDFNLCRCCLLSISYLQLITMALRTYESLRVNRAEAIRTSKSNFTDLFLACEFDDIYANLELWTQSGLLFFFEDIVALCDLDVNEHMMNIMNISWTYDWTEVIELNLFYKKSKEAGIKWFDWE